MPGYCFSEPNVPETVLFIGKVVPLEPSCRCFDSEEGKALLLEGLLRSNWGVASCCPLMLMFALATDSAPDFTCC